MKLLIVLSAVALLIGKHVYELVARRRRRARIAREHGCKPVKRYPHKDPLLGLDRIRLLMKARSEQRFIRTMRETLERYGTTYRAKLFTETVITTCDPANMKVIYSTNFADFDSTIRGRLLKPFLGDGIFTTDGEVWQHSRAMIRPNFSRAQVANIDAIEEILQDMLKHVPTDGSTVDLQPLFFGLTMDTSTEFLFGESVYSSRGDSAEGQKFVDAYERGAWEVAVRASTGILALLKGMSKEEKAAIEYCQDFVKVFVDKALARRDALKAKPTSQYTFLDELVKETQDPVRIRAEVMNLLLAGRDTTASLLSNMFFQLAKRPDLWARLRQEIAPLAGARPSFEQLKNMRLLQWCMKESLRLNTIVPGTFRSACKDTVLPVGGGDDGQSPILVEAGTIVSIFTGAMHTRRDIWGEDCLEYSPDRWENLRPGAWDYLPFSGGPRICIGQQYALTEAGYVTARMVQLFSKMESHDAGPWLEKVSITCCSHNGARVGLTPA